MQLHISAVVVDNKLIYIGDDLLYLVYGKKQAVTGKENKAVRKLFPAIFMEFYNSGVQKRLIITIKCQVAGVSPVSKLVNNTVK